MLPFKDVLCGSNGFETGSEQKGTISHSLGPSYNSASARGRLGIEPATQKVQMFATKTWRRLFFLSLIAIGITGLTVAQEADQVDRVEQVEAEAEPVAAEKTLADPNEEQREPTPADSAQPYARLVRVPLPIEGTVDTRVRRVLDQIIANAPKSTERPIVVLEFWPPMDGNGDSSEFGRSLDLARYLASSKTNGVRTVAYIPKTTKGHAVLVALACEQIIMHPDAKLGAAGINEDSIDPTVRRGYSEIADRRRTIPSAVALGMLDPELQVQRVTTAMGVRYSLTEDVPEIQQTTTVQAIDTIIPAGEEGLLAGDKLRLDFGFVSHLAQDRQELASSLEVPPSDLEIDPSFGGEWSAVRVDLSGPMNAVIVNQVMSSIEDRMQRDPVNFICVAIDSPGGSMAESLRLASFLAELDSTKTRTVAYVRREALADASIVALACDQLVMHPEAVLGGSGAREPNEDDIRLARLSLEEIADSNSKNWSLSAAMVDPQLEVHRYQLAESTVTDFFCEEELEQQRDPTRWQKKEEISPASEVLQLNGNDALDMRIANHVVDDFSEFRQAYQLKDAPEELKPNWAHEFVRALARPQVAGGLLFIGFFAMIAELSAPGISLGGFIAAVCFLLFFWSNFLHGTAGWLEVLLFLAGIIFVAMEIFVIPGFGIFGLGGGFLILASLVLASQTFVIPQNAYQLRHLPQSMFIVVGALAGVFTSGFLLRKYIDQSPYFRKVMLAPPEGAVAAERERREAVVHYDHLMGQQGRATTPLVPAGKADFDGELVDVVSDGLAVDKNATVVVVEVAGNRVVVREQS